MAKKAFVTGAAGYIGGSVAARLQRANYQVKGLTRSESAAEKLKSIGIEPVIGDLSNRELLVQSAREADLIVDAADADNESAVKSMIEAISGSDRVLIHTSGSSIVADRANGEPSQRIFDESTENTPDEHKQARVNIDKLVIGAAAQGIRTVVICPCMIYGPGLGPKLESQQIPNLIKQAIKSGVARCIGRGENIWSTVHIEDLVELYLIAAEKAPPGGVFLFAENGEITFKQLVEEIKKALDLKTAVEGWSIEQAAAEWTFEGATFGLGSNSRIRGNRSRELGWQPKHNSVLQDVQRCYANLLVSSQKHN